MKCMERIFKRSNSLITDICLTPANYNSRKIVSRLGVKAYVKIWGSNEEGISPGNRFLAGSEARVITKPRHWGWVIFGTWNRRLGGFRKKEAMHCRDENVGMLESTEQPSTCSTGDGRGSETTGWTRARAEQPLNSILRRFTFIQRQLRKIIKKKNE